MAKITTLAQPVTAVSGTAARLSQAGAIVFVLLLAALHGLKAELDPSWHFISEYAIGDFGWMMALAFFALAVSYLALFFAVRSQAGTLGGRLGLVLLLVSAVGLFLGGAFTTDPITTSPEAMTTAGKLHSLGGTLGMAMPVAAALLSWSLGRKPDWAAARPALYWSAGLALTGFLVAFLSLGILISQSGGQFGPQTPVGWPNRFEMLTYCVWLVVVAGQAARLSSRR